MNQETGGGRSAPPVPAFVDKSRQCKMSFRMVQINFHSAV